MALTAAEEKELADLKQMAASLPDEPAPSIPETVAGWGKAAFPYAMKVLDMTSAPVRKAMSVAAGVDKPEEGWGLDVWNPENTTPSVDEILKRKGMPESGKLSDLVPSLYQEPGTATWLPEKGGMFDPTGRGTLGTMIEMVADPATLVTGGTKSGVQAYLKNLGEDMAKRGVYSASLGKRAAAFAKTLKNPKSGLANQLLFNPIGTALERTGAMIYSSGLKPANRVSVAMGHAPVSNQMLKQGMWGGAESLVEQTGARSKQLQALAEKIEKKVTDAGGKINMDQAMNAARAELARMKEIPDNALAAGLLERSIKRNAALGDVPMERARRIKTNLYADQPSEAFNMAKRTPEGARVRAAQASGIREANEAAAEKVSKGMGKELSDINQEWGGYLTADDALRAMAGTAADTAIPARTVARGLVGALSPGNLAGMTTSAIRATPIRTAAGLLMARAGGNVPWLLGARPSALVDAYVRRRLIQGEQERSPWSLLRGEEQ